MSKLIKIPNGTATLVETNFKCPKCECYHTEDDYYNKLYNSKDGLIYKSCKGCKTKLGITSNIEGDIVVWLKEEEITYKLNVK